VTDHIDSTPRAQSPARITAVAIRHAGTDSGRNAVTSGEPVTITVGYETSEPVNDALLEVELLDRSGRLVFKTDTDRIGAPLGRLDGAGSIEFHTDNVPLLDGDYPLSVRLSDREHGHLLDLREGQHRLQVVSHDRASGLVSMNLTVTAERSVTSGVTTA
jgi:hypothetical protein